MLQTSHRTDQQNPTDKAWWIEILLSPALIHSQNRSTKPNRHIFLLKNVITYSKLTSAICINNAFIYVLILKHVTNYFPFPDLIIFILCNHYLWPLSLQPFFLPGNIISTIDSKHMLKTLISSEKKKGTILSTTYLG